MTHLDRFRIVKLPDDLCKEMGLPEFICADASGRPFLEGRAFYRWLTEENGCESSTAHDYLYAILPFLTFLQAGSPPQSYTAPAEQIRHRVQAYLKEKLACIVRPHHGGNFVVKASPTLTTNSVRLFLTALKQFYTCAILKNWYTDSNPLVWIVGLLARERGLRPTMPPQSGLTLPADRTGRVPDTYFCVVSGDWQPHIIEDPNLPKTLLAGVTRPRDRLIIRMLFESGARVGEVLGLRLGDWRSRQYRERALTTNKGSRGEHVKEIWWSSTTAQLLQTYIDQERRRCDPRGQGFAELPDTASIFVTEQGKPYTYAAFYANWQYACQTAGLKVTPHQARHWFVTMALHKFESLPQNQRDVARQSLIAYMGWRNAETIKAYDHHLLKLDFAPTHTALMRLVETGDAEVASPAGRALPTRPDHNAIPNLLWERLDQLLNDD